MEASTMMANCWSDLGRDRIGLVGSDHRMSRSLKKAFGDKGPPIGAASLDEVI